MKRKISRADIMRRNATVWQTISAGVHDDNDSGALVMSVAILLRYDFGKRYLTFRRFFKVVWGILVYLFFLGILMFTNILPEFLIEGTKIGMGLMLMWLVLCIVAYIIHSIRKGVKGFNRVELHSWHSGTSILRPIAKLWLAFWNWVFTIPQRIVILMLPKRKRFSVRDDFFYNDVAICRQFLEPLFALSIAIASFIVQWFPITLWFAGSALALWGNAGLYMKNYREYFDNLKDEEILAEETRSTHSYHQENVAKKKYRSDKSLDAKRATVSPPKQKLPPATPDDFSLDEAFESLNSKSKDKSNKT